MAGSPGEGPQLSPLPSRSQVLPRVFPGTRLQAPAMLSLPVTSRRLGTELVESRAPGKGDLAPALSGEGEELLCPQTAVRQAPGRLRAEQH